MSPNITPAIAMDVPICATAAPRTVPSENRRRSSMGAGLRRSWRTKAIAATTAPATEPMVGTESQPFSTPLVSA